MKKRNIVLGVVIYGAICGFIATFATFVLIPVLFSLISLFLFHSIFDIDFAGLFAILLRSAPWLFFSVGGFMSGFSALALTEKKDNPFKAVIFMLCSRLGLK